MLTLQSHLRSKCYISKWDLNKTLYQTQTIIVSESGCSSMKYDQSGNIGVTGVDGTLYFINGYNMSVDNKVKIGENMIKCGIFYKNFFISGSSDNYLRITGYSTGVFKYLFHILKFFLFCCIIFSFLIRIYHLGTKLGIYQKDLKYFFNKK